MLSTRQSGRAMHGQRMLAFMALSMRHWLCGISYADLEVGDTADLEICATRIVMVIFRYGWQ